MEENQTPQTDFDLPGAFSQLKLKELLPREGKQQHGRINVESVSSPGKAWSLLVGLGAFVFFLVQPEVLGARSAAAGPVGYIGNSSQPQPATCGY